MPRRSKTTPISRAPYVRHCQTKRRFTNENAARKAAEDGMLINPGLKLSVYRCNDCGGWHLTSSKP